MRPRILEIEGLNSFIEMQRIDFSILTQRGLFGVFGPTGSGKSSILDAIILALYGEIPRGTREYINTVTNKLYVSFEFDTYNGEKREIYRVDRAMRRSKEGAIKTDFARLYSLSDESIVLAEKVLDVNKFIKNIIGLESDDFTRSVILPQGKFSEFLKLPDKIRNDMMERMLRLSKYGTKLSDAVKHKKNKNENELNVLIGERNRYEDVSKDKLDELSKEYEITLKAQELIKIKLKELNDEYQNSNKFYELQTELKQYQSKKNNLDLLKQEINENKEQVSKANKALSIWSTIEEWLKLEDDVQKYSKKLSETKKELQKEKRILDDIKIKHETLLEQKNNDVAKLSVKEHEVNEAIQLKKEADVLNEEAKEYKQKHNSTLKGIELISRNINELLVQKDKIGEILTKSHEKIKELKIAPDYKEKIDEGLYIENNVISYIDKIKDVDNQIKYYNNKKSDDIKVLEKLELEAKNKKMSLQAVETQILSLENKPPLKQDDIIKSQKEIQHLEQILNNTKNIESEIKDKQNKLCKIDKEIKNNEDLIRDIKQNIAKTTLEYEDLEKEINLKREKLYAYELAQTLTEGKVCPVCGSKEHPSICKDRVDVKIVDTSIDNALKKYKEEISDIKIKQAQLITVNERLNIQKYELIDDIKNREKLLPNEALENIKKTVAEKNNVLNNNIAYLKQWNQDIDKFRSKESTCKEEINEIDKKLEAIKARIKQYESFITENTTKVNALNEEYIKLSQELSKYKNDLKVDSFKNKIQEIYTNEKSLKAIESDINNYDSELNKLNIKLESLKENKAHLNIDCTKYDENYKQREKIIFEYKEKIGLICGKFLPQEYLEELKAKKNRIIEAERDLKNRLDEKNNIVNKLYENNAALSELLKDKHYEYQQKKEKINNIIKDNGFDNVEGVKLSIISEEEIQSLNTKITDYEDEVKRIVDNIKRVTDIIGNRVIDKKELTLKLELIKAKEDEYKKLNEQKGSLEQNIQTMKENLIAVEQLDKKIQEKEHIQDMLKELQTLIKGKNFVKYVSKSHLEYILREASKSMMDITNNRYCLELDSGNGFIICDNYNGGVRRSCKTLSGGETFIASLCLALALSSHVQLKGSASLEFFFLDEGFGTLDTSSLDLVMTALEKLRTQNLCIGIISHVEELKNRVPIKIIVDSAKAGIRGTKLSVEY